MRLQPDENAARRGAAREPRPRTAPCASGWGTRSVARAASRGARRGLGGGAQPRKMSEWRARRQSESSDT